MDEPPFTVARFSLGTWILCSGPNDQVAIHRRVRESASPTSIRRPVVPFLAVHRANKLRKHIFFLNKLEFGIACYLSSTCFLPVLRRMAEKRVVWNYFSELVRMEMFWWVLMIVTRCVRNLFCGDRKFLKKQRRGEFAGLECCAQAVSCFAMNKW